MQVCAGNDNSFVILNQKGIDPPSLDLLAREGVSYDWLCIFFRHLIVRKAWKNVDEDCEIKWTEILTK